MAGKKDENEIALGIIAAMFDFKRQMTVYFNLHAIPRDGEH